MTLTHKLLNVQHARRDSESSETFMLDRAVPSLDGAPPACPWSNGQQVVQTEVCGEMERKALLRA